jgi:very-short-patch-repair endonuclease
MRREPTFNERVLWKLLRNRRLDDLKFRRQVPIGPYIADFVCFGSRLVVEADGPLHDPVADAERDAWLNRQGFVVLRFRNSQISQEPEAVLADILAAANPSSGPSGHLLPQGEKDVGA